MPDDLTKMMDAAAEIEIWKGLFRLTIYRTDDDGRRIIAYRVSYTPADFYETIYGARGALAAINQHQEGADVIAFRQADTG